MLERLEVDVSDAWAAGGGLTGSVAILALPAPTQMLDIAFKSAMILYFVIFGIGQVVKMRKGAARAKMEEEKLRLEIEKLKDAS